jgi:amino-acid N-acetyltransferase
VVTLRSVLIRPARPEDAEAIVCLLDPYVADGIVLPRTAAEVRAAAVDFLVAEREHGVVGAVAVRDYGHYLVEIRSLVVATTVAGRGLGSALVAAAVDLARQRGARRVFALTLRPALFERQHFLQVDRDLFPQKVWADCSNCPKRSRCDEVAVAMDLQRTTASDSTTGAGTGGSAAAAVAGGGLV